MHTGLTEPRAERGETLREREATAMGKKQVIMLMTDSQRKDMVGCYGNPDMKTPNLDRLAAEGVRFTQAFTTQPVCQPARAALFTGSYPHSCAGWSNCMGISDNVQNIGRRLGDHGIHCAYIGKWHLDGGDYFGLGRAADGWDPDYWYDMRNYLEELTPEERYLSRQTKSMETEEIRSEFTYGHRCSDRAIDFVKKHQEEDYFLVVSYDEPHGPFLCPKEFWSQYEGYEFPRKENMRDDLKDKPEHHRIWAGENYLAAAEETFTLQPKYFLGCNSFADAQIGRVLEAVSTYAPDAVILYTSDHGDMLYSHSLTGKGPAMYQEITNVPLLVKGKEFGVGVVDENPVSHINLAPTIFDLFGVEKPKVLEGKSIYEELKNGVRCNEFVFLEFGRYEVDHDGFGGYQPVRAVYDGRYKLVINLMTSDEFYDLQEDPGEMTNRIQDPALDQEKRRLHEALLWHMYETRDPFRGYYWEDRPWDPIREFKTWDSRKMTRQRENEEYEPRQLDYGTGLPMEQATRFK